MSEKKIYMDHNATTPVDKEVYNAMAPYFMDYFGNASSMHFFGKEAKKALEDARGKVARLIGAENSEIVFTSGGTEADNFAVFGVARSKQSKGKHIITSQIEHHAVLNPCKMLEKEGFEITYLPVDDYGVVNIDELREAVKEDTILISIMTANNELGTIQPVKEIGDIAKKHGVIFHTDAVQAVGKIPVNVKEMNIDLLSMSSHKLYGPKGVGSLFIKEGVKISPVQYGGHHESGRRAGTENISGIVGFGKACEIAEKDMQEENARMVSLREKLYDGIKENIPEVHLNGHPELRLSGTLSLCFKYIEGESILLMLNSVGVAASSGSACTSGSMEPSHVLLATGIGPELARGSIRFSLGKENTVEEINYVIDSVKKIINNLREMSPYI